MPSTATLRIEHAELIEMLISSAEGMHDVEIDMVRELIDDKRTSVIDSKDVHFHFNRASAIQEVVQKLKHASLIPPPSHSHPTIIPLTSQHQVDVVDTIIDFAFDWQNDTVTEPLWELKTKMQALAPLCGQAALDICDQLRNEMNMNINRLVWITKLQAAWEAEKR